MPSPTVLALLPLVTQMPVELATVIVTFREKARVLASVAVTRKAVEWVLVGVPLSRPSADRVSPGGVGSEVRFSPESVYV